LKVSEFNLMAQQSEHRWYKARAAFLKDVLDKVTPLNGRSLRILDLACALGGNFPLLARYGRPIGLDISPIAISSSFKRGMAMVQADAQMLPFADESLDIVVALDVFEHLPRDRKGLSECMRVLGPGGWLIFNLPACPALFSDHDRAFDHYRRYTKKELWQKLSSAGFDVKSINCWSFSLFPVVFFVRCILQKILKTFNISLESGSDFKYPVPGVVLKTMGLLAWIERGLIQKGFSLPWGVSLFGYAQKPVD